MTRIVLLLAILLFLILPAESFSYTECARPVNKVWTNLISPDFESVWVLFSDGGGAIYKSQSQISTGQMARFFSMALLATSTGKDLIVRYPEDGLSCPPSETRNDFMGVWSK